MRALPTLAASSALAVALGCAPPAPVDDAGAPQDAGGSDGACPVVGDAACGGDVSGTWTFVALCPAEPDDVPCENPFSGEPACADADVACALHVEGSLAFADGDVHVVRAIAVDATYGFPDACVQAVRPDEASAADACAALANPPALSCTHDGTTCTCIGRTEDEPIDESVPYTTDGASIAFADFTATYCVADDALTLDFDPHPASWRYWVLAR